MKYVGHLAAGALICNSHVNYVTLKHLQILLFNHELLIDPPPPGGILYTMIF